MGRGEAHTGFWWGNLREKDHVGDSDLDWRIILSWIFRKLGVGIWTRSSWLSIRTGGGHFECGNGPSVSIKCGEILD
jgi:hypothetical protein